jgi:predicted GNAT superfamily acetyltransferase
MDWYEKLNDYFPEHEMKDKQQLEDLISQKEVYHKEESSDHIVLYAEFTSFIFIDYLLVTSNERGKGIGSKILLDFKQKGKLILLEAEPKSPKDQDTAKRLAFYMKNGFKKADQIEYMREDEQGKTHRMNILYWSPSEHSQEIIMDKMKKACQEIHNFHSRKYYGRLLADPKQALNWKH